MARPSYLVEYLNKITLKLLKNIICPHEQLKSFVNQIFEPLKSSGFDNISDEYNVINSHLYEFANGNINKENKRISVNSLKIWASSLTDKTVYAQFLDNISGYAELNDEQLDQIMNLFELDRDEMPPKFSSFIEQAFQDANYSQAIMFLLLWSIYGKDQIHLLNNIYNIAQVNIIPENKDEAKLLNHVIPSKPIFFGREGVLRSISEKLNSGGHFVFLQGMGGIGKSECAKQYAQKYKGNYNTIVFAECSTTLMDLLNDNTTFTLTKPFISERLQRHDGSYESDSDFFERKLTQLRCSVDLHTLIILDNVDHQDSNLMDFLTGICDVIVTTRCNMQTDYPFNTVAIDGINDMAVCKKIFSEYCENDDAGDVYTEKIISYFSGHPMAMELAANQMKVSGVSSENMWEIVRSQNQNIFEEGFSILCRNREEINMSAHIQQLFSLAELKSDEIYVLKCMSLLPKKGMEKSVFKKICGLRNYVPINNLYKRSWIRNLNGILSLHTLVKDMIHMTYKPDLSNCSMFIEGIMREFSASKFYYGDLAMKSYMFEYISHIYELFPEPEIGRYEFYEWIELIMSHYGQSEKALNLSRKLYKLYLTEYGELHFRTARMICRTGCNEKNLYQLNASLKTLEKGLDRLLKLKDPTDEIMLYISDVDVVLTDSYYLEYEKTNDKKFLTRSTELCREIIRIRKPLSEKFEAVRVNCTFAYCFLARLSIAEKNYRDAEIYVQKAEEEYKKSDLSSLDFYINYTKAELLIAQNQTDKAIFSLMEALKNRDMYFNSCEGDSGTNTLKLKITLGEIYEQNGFIELALQRYQDALNAVEDMPFYNEIILMLKQRINKLKFPKQRNANQHENL